MSILTNYTQTWLILLTRKNALECECWRRIFFKLLTIPVADVDEFWDDLIERILTRMTEEQIQTFIEHQKHDKD